MSTVNELDNRLEVEGRLPLAARAILMLFALIPLVAPYELIVKPAWTPLGLPFLVAAAISIGALVITGLLLFASLAALSFRFRLDKATGFFTHWATAPILRWQRHQGALQTITRMDIQVHDWTDGPPTYSLHVVTAGGPRLQVGSSPSLLEMEEIKRRIEAFLGPRFPMDGPSAA
jgi:hypothetical protein